MEQNPLAAPAGPDRIAILKEIALTLNEAASVPNAMNQLLPRLVAILGLHSAWAFRYDEGGRTFHAIAHTGLPPALSEQDCQPLRDGWCECQAQFAAEQLDRAVNVVKCSRLDHAQGDKRGLIFHASVPLRGKRRALGILNVAAAGRALLSEDMLALLSAIGNQLAIALERDDSMQTVIARGEQFRELLPLGQQLFALREKSDIYQRAVDIATTRFGFPIAGVVAMRGIDGEILALSEVAPDHDSEEQTHYSYWSAAEIAEARRAIAPHLLADACSSLSACIGDTGLYVYAESSSPSAFSETDAQILQSLATYVAAALDNVELHAEMAQSAAWSERRQIAADLHDSVNQRLFSAALLTKAALLALPEHAANAAQTLTRVAALLQESQQEMKTVVSTLRERETPHLTLGAYLREQAHRLTLQGGLRARVHVGKEPDLSGRDLEQLCKIIDEALQNTMKHAEAVHVWLSVYEDDGLLKLTIEDDGRGFFPGSAEHAGIGLSSMRQRATAIGGELSVMSSPGVSTRVTFTRQL